MHRCTERLLFHATHMRALLYTSIAQPSGSFLRLPHVHIRFSVP